MSGVSEPASSNMKGVTFDMFDQIGVQLNIKFEFKRLSWKRCVQGIERGTIDAAPNVIFQEKRIEWARFPLSEQGVIDPTFRIYEYPYTLYHNKNKPLSWDGKQFSHLLNPIGVVLAYAIAADLEEQGIDVLESADVTYLLTLLKGQRISALASFSALIDPIIRDSDGDYSEIVKHSIPLRMIDGYLVFSHYFYWEHATTANDIWHMIREMRETGETNRLLDKYKKYIAEKYLKGRE